MNNKVGYLLIILAVLGGCTTKSSRKKTDGAISLGAVSEKLQEASGIVSSVANAGMLWVINDSGNSPDIFLIDTTARIKMTVRLTGAENRDWEDISIGAGPDPVKKYIYVADIGDNFARHKFKFIYRFEEPVFAGEGKITIDSYQKLVVQLSDGKRDMETILIDPGSHDLYMVSKREDQVGLYHASFPFGDTIRMKRVQTLAVRQIVAGSISADGKNILLKNYDKIFLWRRLANEPLEKLMEKVPDEVPYDGEAQGEAITWSMDGNCFYTLSESEKHTRAQLRRYPSPALDQD